MPRPTNKNQLISLGHENFEKLMSFINRLPEAEQHETFPPGTLNRNIRDILAHLHHWHLMMESWYDVGMNAEKPAMPAPGYTWKTVPELNREIQKKYAQTPLNEIKIELRKSFDAIQILIEKHSDEELFEKKRYPWTGSTSLGAYFVSATSSHYDWALKLIKRVRKNRIT